MDKARAYLYVFYVPACGMAKIGHTTDLEKREYAIRYGALSRTCPSDSHEGRIVAVVPLREITADREAGV